MAFDPTRRRFLGRGAALGERLGVDRAVLHDPAAVDAGAMVRGEQVSREQVSHERGGPMSGTGVALVVAGVLAIVAVGVVLTFNRVRRLDAVHLEGQLLDAVAI